jgi:hypothetical protein
MELRVDPPATWLVRMGRGHATHAKRFYDNLPIHPPRNQA